MLARTLLDQHYGDFEELLFGIADVLAEQVVDLPCSYLQIDEANLPGNPEHGAIATSVAAEAARRTSRPSPYATSGKQ